MKRIVLLTLFAFLRQSILLFGQVDDMIDRTIVENLIAQLEIWPQEKMHLHTDRDYYVPGEIIWFKAYVTDAVTHQYPTYSQYLYVELIDAQNTVVNRAMIRLENQMFHGYLFLSQIIPEGNYTLRAYTRHLENLGDDFFFKKNIRIGSFLKGNDAGRAYTEQGQKNEKIGKSRGNGVVGASLALAQNDFEVSFFPEGGNVVEGVMNKIAFKALNRNGASATISGKIVNENGTEIISVETFHEGMGVFGYSPEIGKRYFLICQNESGMGKKFELPQPSPHACSLTATWQNKKILIGLHQSIHSTDSPCYLLAHCRGVILYFDTWNSQIGYTAFAEEDLPEGVIQFILFDKQMNPLSERLVFSKNFNYTKPDFQTDKKVYEKREKINATLSLLPSTSARTGDGFAHFSVSITDDNDIAIDSSTTILSSLLLSSELKGYIEDPAWYLQDNRVSSTALDYLMMTHGWRRYNIPEVVKGNLEYPPIPFQTNRKLSGRVKSLILSRPVANSEIAFLTNEGEYGFTLTDETGAFLFDNFDYPDSTSFFVQAFGRRGSSWIELVVDGESFPAPVYAPQSSVMAETDNYPSLQINAFTTKVEQRSLYEEDMRLIQLDEIEVTAPRIERKDEARLRFWANVKSDVTIKREEIERHSFNHIAQYLRLITGVQVSGTSYVSIRGGKMPLILVDGFPLSNGIASNETDREVARYSFNSLDDIPVDIIESIDVFKGTNLALFGSRGANGVISITTRTARETAHSERNEPNSIVYTSFGYQKPVEFYSPKYETLESKHLTIPDYRTTIFWKPDVVISDSGEASFEFYTSDFSTTYSVVIEGLTTDGRIIRQVEKIHVK